jgi:acetyl esterase/lipase
MKIPALVLALLLPLGASQKLYRIMPVGDSITEGGASFSNWRYDLWEKLYTAGYLIEYVGSRRSPSRIGELAHEGYGGKDSAFLAKTVPARFKEHPADIVLLHAGHNHFAEQKPVPDILRNTGRMIDGFRRVNPRVTILLAQPITSGKLPKYSYIPELNDALVLLASRLDQPSSRVIIVPQASGFDPAHDTVADKVHPNKTGAEKMADRWFESLTSVMEKPPVGHHPDIIPYKETDKGKLTLHVFKPAGPASATPRPAIVFFYGGGWVRGTPIQFYRECQHFADKGMVAISADYRTSFTHGTTPFEAVADGRSAIRWIRSHAKELAIDPSRIVAAGASAGGQIAAATGVLTEFDEPGEDCAVSCRPDAMALWYPVFDNGPEGYGPPEVKARHLEFSPLHNVGPHTPPCIVFLGTSDKLIPVSTGRDFQSRLKKAGVRCDLELYPGDGHPIYDYRKPATAQRARILGQLNDFLKSLGILK